MFIIKRFDEMKYYTQSRSRECNSDGGWTDDIKYAKVYIGISPATAQSNMLRYGNSYHYSKAVPNNTVQVIEVGLVEL